MGEDKARRVFMSARLFGAEEAKELNLLARVVDESALDAAVEAEVLPYLAAAPEAVAASKRLARALGPAITDAVIHYTIKQLVETWEGEEAKAGINAFFNKEKAPWVV